MSSLTQRQFLLRSSRQRIQSQVLCGALHSTRQPANPRSLFAQERRRYSSCKYVYPVSPASSASLRRLDSPGSSFSAPTLAR